MGGEYPQQMPANSCQTTYLNGYQWTSNGQTVGSSSQGFQQTVGEYVQPCEAGPSQMYDGHQLSANACGQVLPQDHHGLTEPSFADFYQTGPFFDAELGQTSAMSASAPLLDDLPQNGGPSNKAPRSQAPIPSGSKNKGKGKAKADPKKKSKSTVNSQAKQDFPNTAQATKIHKRKANCRDRDKPLNPKLGPDISTFDTEGISKHDRDFKLGPDGIKHLNLRCPTMK